MGFNLAAEGIESAWQHRKRALTRAMRARRRCPRRLQAVKTADQTLGQFPIARRPARLHPPEARTMATIPARTATGRRCQTEASSATSVGIASASMRMPIARLGRQSLQLCPGQKGQGGKLLRLLLRPLSGRDVRYCYHKGLRKPLQIPPHPFFGMASFQRQSDYDPAAPARRNASARHTGKPISGGQTTQPLRSILSAGWFCEPAFGEPQPFEDAIEDLRSLWRRHQLLSHLVPLSSLPVDGEPGWIGVRDGHHRLPQPLLESAYGGQAEGRVRRARVQHAAGGAGSQP